MKSTSRHAVLAATLLVLLLPPLGCDDSGTNDDNTPGSPEGSLLSHSGCKFEVTGSPKAEADSSEVDVASWTYDGDVLRITHVNGAFNCCVETLTAEIEIAGDTIRVREAEVLENGGCRCLCLYDLEYEVKDIAAGSWRIEFEEMNVPDGEESIAFDAVLTDGASGRHEVVRGDYPWGVE